MIIQSNIKLLPYYQTDFPVKSHSPRTESLGQTTYPKIFHKGPVHQPTTPLANRIKTLTHGIEGAKNLHTYGPGRGIEIRPMQTLGLLIDIYT
jgi:hypothetical protein